MQHDKSKQKIVFCAKKKKIEALSLNQIKNGELQIGQKDKVEEG